MLLRETDLGTLSPAPVHACVEAALDFIHAEEMPVVPESAVLMLIPADVN